MPRVHTVKKARKDYPNYGIKKGETYYHWSFNYGPTVKSKIYPKQSQLTQSDFLQQVYALQERLEEISTDSSNLENARCERDDIVSELRSLAEECEERRNNMPESLQDAPSGQTLESRVDSCNEMADELESIDLDIELEGSDDEEEQESNQEDFDNNATSALEELTGISYNGE